jgi:hypothetical protein
LGQLSHEFEAPAPWQESDEAPAEGAIGDQVQVAAARHLRDRMQDMVRDVDARFQEKFLLPEGGLRAVCAKGEALHGSVVDDLRAMARAEILNAMRLDESVWGAGTAANDRLGWLEKCLEVARPKVSDCGGAQRLLAIIPAGSAALQETATVLTPPATIVTDADAELVLCYEQQALSLAHVAARLIDGRSDIIQIAGRLHTRMDVPWSKLPQVGHRAVAECAAH